MPGANLIILLLGCSASLGSGKYLEAIPTLQLEKTNPDLHDDIRLTPEQIQEKKERGFYTPGKWPKKDGIVRVPYYFDTRYFPQGHPIRETFKKATDIYKQQTCIEWVEVDRSVREHKVRVFQGDGCYSAVGMTRGEEQDISIGEGCLEVGTMLHEMGHCMGLFHTQSRPDRDEWVKPWIQYVKPSMVHNFGKEKSETFNIPYDYKSMMHYGNDYFSINNSYTLTPFDPYAMFAIGGRPNTFRYSDAAFLNNGYSCISDFVQKCGDLGCRNGGFVGKNCQCRCPENTVGSKCEQTTGALFSDKPKCGGDVTKEMEIVPLGYPKASTSDKCIFRVLAPYCKLPSITFTEALFYWDVCEGNRLSLQVSQNFFGYNWCDHKKIPLGRPIVSETNTAAIFYNTGASGFPNLGFKAMVRFVPDPKCRSDEGETA